MVHHHRARYHDGDDEHELHVAVEALPLGIASTLLFLSPVAVAASAIRRPWEILLPVMALIGVVVVSGPSGETSALGIGLGLLSAAALAAYTLLSRQVGRVASDVGALALSVSASAVLLMPASLSSVGRLGVREWIAVAAAGLLGVGLDLSFDYYALRLTAARVVATLFALDPVFGVLIGWTFLDQPLQPSAMGGIAAILAAGATTTWLVSSRTQPIALEPAS